MNNFFRFFGIPKKMANFANRNHEIRGPEMKCLFRLLCLICLLMSTGCVLSVHGADKVKYPGGKQYLYRVMLSDKQGCGFTTSHPERFLSQRSIERRRRQHIAVDSTDLPVSEVYIRLLQDEGVEVVSRSKWNNTVLVRSRDSRLPRKLSALGCVQAVRKVWTSPDSINSPRHRQKVRGELNRWDSIASGHYGVTTAQIEMLNGIRLHNQGFRGRGMLIAVLDGGFMNVDDIPVMRRVHLAGTADVVAPPSKSIYRETDHGTMVLSAMAAEEPGLYVGTAPEADYWLIRCEDTEVESLAEEDFWARAVELADSAGVDVVNSSLGYHAFDEKSDNYRYYQQDGQTAFISRTASMLAQKGIVLVNSAGNDGMGTWKRINFPSDAHDILSVGAVTSDGCNAAFSGVGPSADGRVKPDVMAQGSPTAVITGRGIISRDIGTSFSTPLVAGLVACLWQAFPEKTALEIINLVRQSSSNVATPDNIMGYGVPDFWKAYQMGKRKQK